MSLKRVEDSLAPLLSLYKGQIATDIRHYTSSEVEYPKGEVDCKVIYEPYQQISEHTRACFFTRTIHINGQWKDDPLVPKFSVSQHIQSSLEDTLKGLADRAKDFLDKGPIATIDVTISISINFFDSVHAKHPIKSPSFGGNFRVKPLSI